MINRQLESIKCELNGSIRRIESIAQEVNDQFQGVGEHICYQSLISTTNILRQQVREIDDIISSAGVSNGGKFGGGGGGNRFK